MKKNRKKTWIIASLMILILFITSCTHEQENLGVAADRGLDVKAFSRMSLSGVDRVGRSILPMDKQKVDQDRYVGLFYLVWLGQEPSLQDGIYNITKLMETEEGRENLWNYVDPDPNISPVDKFHFVNEPLYGYYNSGDKWVVTRHLELFMLAGIDYLYVDVSNGNIYEYNSGLGGGKEVGGTKVLLDTALELYQAGWDVPKIMFFTNSYSGQVTERLYKAYYEDGKYDDIWFKPYGKPMISAITANNNNASDMKPGAPGYVEVSKTMQSYFDIRESQWPVPTSSQIENGFQWMSWTHPQHINGNMISVTPAQHSPNSSTYSAMNKQSSRGYDYTDIRNPVHEDWEAGINFERQWETVFSQGYEDKLNFVNITGWNEWTPIKYPNKNAGGQYIPIENGQVIYFVDGFSAEYSRDIEMDREYYQDNFYLQMVRNVRKYKYGTARQNYIWKEGNSFTDAICYADMTGDAMPRDYYGFDTSMRYTDNSNRNDIANVRVIHDGENIYFEIETKDDLLLAEADKTNWMNLLIKTGAEGKSFEGYQYVINRSPRDGKTSIERSTGGYEWQVVGEAIMAVEGKTLRLTVPRATLGMGSKVTFEFKVADNITHPEEIMDYYISGDSAPIGRLNYSYGY